MYAKGVPLLDLVESLEKGDWDKHHNGLLSMANLNLYSQHLLVLVWHKTGEYSSVAVQIAEIKC